MVGSRRLGSRTRAENTARRGGSSSDYQ
jgi:hypothetical protein